jgi:hypothetical protein
MSGWIPKEDDLARRAGDALEEAYSTRHRGKCSREDFADGWLAALRWLGSRSSFLPGRFEPGQSDDRP